MCLQTSSLGGEGRGEILGISRGGSALLWWKHHAIVISLMPNWETAQGYSATSTQIPKSSNLSNLYLTQPAIPSSLISMYQGLSTHDQSTPVLLMFFLCQVTSDSWDYVLKLSPPLCPGYSSVCSLFLSTFKSFSTCAFTSLTSLPIPNLCVCRNN